MNITVCFRNGISAAIASSATAKSLKEIGLNVELIYLDKNDLSKVLEKEDIKPDYIYLYEDEKNNEKDIREFIETNYPNIDIISYNKENSIHYDEHAQTYILDELILNNLKVEEKYIVNDLALIQDLHVIKVSMTELDNIQALKHDNIHIFDSEKEADVFILDFIKENIYTLEAGINQFKKGLERKETMLNKCEALLKQKEQDFVNKYKPDTKVKKDIERDI